MVRRGFQFSVTMASPKWRRLNSLLSLTTRQAFSTTLPTKIDNNGGVIINEEVVVTCHPGLETVLSTELHALGLPVDPGTVTKNSERGRFIIEPKTVTDVDLFRCCLFLGSATSIRWKCASFSARGLAELRRKTANVDWGKYISYQGDANATTTTNNTSLSSIDVRVSSSKSKLFHTGAIRERILLGIYEAFGREGMEDTNVVGRLRTEKKQYLEQKEDCQILLDAHIERDQVDIFLNAYPTPLHQRGYRLQTAKAPLREDLAYAMLMSAGWLPSWIQKNENSSIAGQSRYPGLVDPFCGSGTIIIEGIAMALGLPPGRLRDSPFQGTVMENQDKWRGLIVNTSIPSDSGKNSSLLLRVSASDRDAGAVVATKANAQRAGVWEQLENHLTQSTLSGQPWFENISRCPFSILVVTNPPFGKRVSKKSQLSPLYHTLGRFIQKLYIKHRRNVRGVVLTDNPIFVGKLGHGFDLKCETILRFTHGGEKVSVMEWENKSRTGRSNKRKY
jgi:23S rRNA G2445 N2-methylase RlmL